MADITVVKRDGSQQPFDSNKINLTLLAASEGLPGQIAKVAQIAAELQLTLFDGITTEQRSSGVLRHCKWQSIDWPGYRTAPPI